MTNLELLIYEGRLREGINYVRDHAKDPFTRKKVIGLSFALSELVKRYREKDITCIEFIENKMQIAIWLMSVSEEQQGD